MIKIFFFSFLFLNQFGDTAPPIFKCSDPIPYRREALICFIFLNGTSHLSEGEDEHLLRVTPTCVEKRDTKREIPLKNSSIPLKIPQKTVI